jgi:hypothetical protein
VFFVSFAKKVFDEFCLGASDRKFLCAISEVKGAQGKKSTSNLQPQPVSHANGLEIT